MALFKKTIGTCYGRGFGTSPIDGYLKKLKDWIDSGIAGWRVCDDQSTLPSDPYIVITDAPLGTTANYFDPVTYKTYKYIKTQYLGSEANVIRMLSYMWWDASTHIGYGQWNGYILRTVDSGYFAYDFRAGDECIAITTINGSTVDMMIIDDFDAIPSELEPTSKVTYTTSPLTPGSNVIVPVVDTSVFTLNNWYFICDFQNHSYIEYSQVVGIDPGVSITLSQISYSYLSGSIIGAYPHRYCVCCNKNGVLLQGFSFSPSQLPYWSGLTASQCFSQQPNYIFGRFNAQPLYNVLLQLSPNEDGKYAVMKPAIVEAYGAQNGDTSSMNRMFGTTKNILLASNSGLVARVSLRIISGISYLYISSADQYIFEGSDSIAFLIRDTETP